MAHIGTGSGGRTHTVAHWNLNPARLPIPPYPQNNPQKVGENRENAFPADKEKHPTQVRRVQCGAAYEARTRYLHLGKVALYQMS